MLIIQKIRLKLKNSTLIIKKKYISSPLQYGLLMIMILFANNARCQTFTAKNKPLYDYYGYYFRQEIDITVSGLPGICDDKFGLEKAVLSIQHKRVSDLKITLESPGGASIWLTNRNGKDTGKNYINTAFLQFGKSGLISAGKAPFTGEYRPDGQMEFLNSGQNPNGTWKLFIEDLKEGEDGVLDSVVLVFGNKPAHTIITSKCDMEHIDLCKCANNKPTGELLPDLIIIPFFTQNQVKEYAWNDSVYPGQLRLAATIANIGYGPMEIKGTSEWVCGDKKVDSSQPCPDGKISRLKVKQVIYSKLKDAVGSKEYDAGTMYFENMPGHNHFHVDDWVQFRLVEKDGKKRKIISKGQKVSYCLFTTGIFYKTDGLSKINGKQYGEDMPNYGLGNYPTCNFDKQGISVGGYDTYGMLYEGQFLQLPKGLKSGEYILEIEIDPHHWYKESDRSNNIFRMPVTISKQQR
jgi:hypothetical protein